MSLFTPCCAEKHETCLALSAPVVYKQTTDCCGDLQDNRCPAMAFFFFLNPTIIEPLSKSCKTIQMEIVEVEMNGILSKDFIPYWK